ncbi:MAG: sigma-70 family RNA polymerase sigma factor [Clostridium sp.]|nr:sigma-70 family RNA polymerase sigma factor [Clostridium sp.]MCM1547728.1 sigma-70 family RNA polymerase sigma factor [Ruminococcus sp.]
MKDKRLILKLKKNAAGALDSVINKYSAYVYTVAYNIMSVSFSREDIEETVSDVFIKLWKNADSLHEDKPILPYLSAIAANEARSRMRIKRLDTYYDDSIIENVSGEDFFETLEKTETITMILEAAENTLKSADREIFIRHYFYGEKLEDISNHLELTLSNTKTKLCRARNKIRDYLSERGYGYEK